jgi:UDP-N-acetylglucosamine 2-epimerase (non-hydrolysing)
VGHVEAGLRTYQKYSPFPEEINRKLTSAISDLHFAPTKTAARALLREGVGRKQVFVVGNPVIDALMHVASQRYDFKDKALARVDFRGKRVIAVTAHRRESWGRAFDGMMRALKRIAADHPDVEIVFPVHPNPNVRKSVDRVLRGSKGVVLTGPLDYRDFVKLLKSCYLIITDSGGIQEEAPSLKKPVLVMREVTERPEAVKAGAVKIVGTDFDRIVASAEELLGSRSRYRKMIARTNPYGDGKTSQRIVRIILRELGGKRA